jgi:hypothetical protein
MRKAIRCLSLTALIVLAGLTVTGCFAGPGETQYVNRTNSTEVLTLNRSRTVKTKLISTFHGTSTGTYTLKTEKGTLSGSFSSDRDGIKFRPQEGEPETVKIKSDGSFEYVHTTWQPVPVRMEKSLKAVASSSKPGAAQ